MLEVGLLQPATHPEAAEVIILLKEVTLPAAPNLGVKGVRSNLKVLKDG